MCRCDRLVASSLGAAEVWSLRPATDVHRLLQALLDLPVPVWQHHGLVLDKAGRRLAKRHDALSIRTLRDSGKTPAEVRAMAGFPD